MDDCILWTGAMSGTGYGNVLYKGRQVGTHRRAYMEANGPIPPGMFVLHRCDVRRCINPEHLFLGTQRENIQDASAKGRLLTAEAWQAAHPPESRPRGVTHHRGNASLTAAQVAEIRGLASQFSQRKLAKQFGVSPSQISRIVRGLRWKEGEFSSDY